MIIFSNDPGSKNYGFSLLKLNGIKVSIIKNGLLNNPLSDLISDVQGDYSAYLKEIKRLISGHQIEALCCERYVTRIRGKTIECVNIMIGGLIYIAVSKRIPVKLYNSATWKNAVKKVFDLESFYKMCEPLPDHICDSVFIGIYTLSKMKSNPKILTQFSNKTLLFKLAKNIKASTQWEKKSRKK